MNVDGVVEDVITIILNLKKVVLKVDSDDPNFETTVELHKQEGEVTAADFIHGSEVEVINPEQHIATVSAGGNLSMYLTVRRGVGFVGADKNKAYNHSVGVIAIDSIYTPVTNVSFDVEKLVMRATLHHMISLQLKLQLMVQLTLRKQLQLLLR